MIPVKLCVFAGFSNTKTYGNLGIDINIDQIPLSRNDFIKAVEQLARKKSNSRSPWLVIWSVDYWKVKHLLGDHFLELFRESFQNSKFSKIYFLETLNDESVFQASFTLHRIKE